MTPPTALPEASARADQTRWFAEEVHLHDGALKTYLRSSFPAIRDVDDIAQESYIRIWKHRAATPIRSARALLFTIARHLALDTVRHERRSPFDAVDNLEELAVPDGRPVVHEALGREEKVQLLIEAIDALPARCREVVVLRKLKLLSQRETAARLRISEKGVENQLARGLSVAAGFSAAAACRIFSAMATETQEALPGGDAAAARWVARRDAGLSPAERRELQAWLAADPRHAAAFARADRGRTEFDWPLHAGTVDDVLAGLEHRARQRRTRRRTVAAAGALGAVAVLAFFNGWRGPIVTPDAMPAAAGSTTLVVMEPQRRTLPDGSTVELKDGAVLTAHFDATARRVSLSRGTAHFQVVKGSLPFIVQARGVTAEALGTAFVVEVGAADVSVLVTEGRVAVNRAGETKGPASPGSPPPALSLAVLDPGKTVSVPIEISAAALAPEVASLPALELEDRLAWRIPRLEFNGTPLAEVVAMINRYNQAQFVITDQSLEQLALSGVLRADKVDALVSMLEADFPIAVERRGGEIVLRSQR